MNRGEAPLACGCSHRDQQKGTRGIRAIVATPRWFSSPLDGWDAWANATTLRQWPSANRHFHTNVSSPG